MTRLPPRFSFLAAMIALLGISDPLQAERSQVTIHDGWRFHKGDAAGAEAAVFDSEQWQKVMVPHTWNDAEEPQSAPAKTPYYRGPGWYRRDLDLGNENSDKRTFLQFEAASLVADVYLNGQKLGQHRGGFTGFNYEITDSLKPGVNHLAVRVDNTRTEDVAPLEGDFTVFGGLYRPVHLLETEALCISPMVDGSSGVAIRQSHVSQKSATVTITTHLSDKDSAAKSVALRATILDADGKSLVKDEMPVESTAKAMAQTLTVASPHLWNGIADPYLHSVRVELLADGQVVDTVTEPLGLRFFNFDKDQGFALNGKPYRLRGVCLHQDHADRGWAASHEDLEEDMAIIREIGANAVRMAHYPHSDAMYQLCDRNGIIAWTEIPLVNNLGKSEAFVENACTQLTELIAQRGNHPAVVTWGLWNELQTGAPALPIISKLNDLAHAADPTRPTTAASFSKSERWCPEAAHLTNLLATNTYPGWYGGSPDGMNQSLDNFRKFAPDQPLGVSEYGAGASIYQHQQGMKKGPDPKGKWHPEEWQAIAHEAQWKAIETRPFIWGSFIWNLFDFASAGRTEGDMTGINDKGLVTRDRKVKKDAFYFYKASWSPEPMVYITSRRDTVRTDAVSSIKVYSNADPVRLTVNGKEITGGQSDGVIHRWLDITLKPGENVLEVSAEHDGKQVRDQVIWTLDLDAKPPLHK